MRLTLSVILIAVIFMASGILHLVRPAPYVSIVPLWLPEPKALVLISGVCEILGSLGILIATTRLVAGWGLIALLVAVFPANIQMLVNAHAVHAASVWQAALAARLPLQALLIYWVYQAAVNQPPAGRRCG
jgi:uncharacterized membrane protein